jgi:hypothetical protein
MQTEFLCNYGVNELTKYIKNMKKIYKWSFDPTIYI